MEPIVQHLLLPLSVTVAGGLIVGVLLAFFNRDDRQFAVSDAPETEGIRIVTLVIDNRRFDNRTTINGANGAQADPNAGGSVLLILFGALAALAVFSLLEPVVAPTLLVGALLPGVLGALFLIGRGRTATLALPSFWTGAQAVVGVLGAAGIGVALLAGRPGGRTLAEVGDAARTAALAEQVESEALLPALVGVIMGDMPGIGYALLAGLAAFAFGLMLVWLAWADLLGVLALQRVGSGRAGALAMRLAAGLLSRSGGVVIVKLVLIALGLFAAIAGFEWPVPNP